MRLEHAIFQGPLTVELPLSPSENPAYPGELWRVHTGEFSSAGEGVDVGMVSNGFGFEDSPDCERISGGINSKGPHAVAIGREANLMSWGFYGAPDRMTPSARLVFLNAVVYMSGFDGARPLVRPEVTSREMLTWMLEFVDSLEGMEEAPRQSLASYLRSQFPEEALAAHGLDRAGLSQWYEQNVEWLYVAGPGRPYQVDEDVRALGCSNREPSFFDAVLAELERDADSEPALRLLERYLPEGSPRDAAGLRRWRERHRDALFFSDVGGYRWFVDPRVGS